MSVPGFPEPADPTEIRLDAFLPHPPGKVWRALTEPGLRARWLMPGDFRLEVGHRTLMRSLPRPGTGFSGTVAEEVLAYEPERMLRVRWTDAAPGDGDGAADEGVAGDGGDAAGGAGGADWTITWTLEPEGRGTRLFLVHAGFDPDDPLQRRAHRIMGGGWSSQVLPALAELLRER
ncbi:SRPBCC domain-containing protein [Streptomyces sp. WMMC500]|uniref:SRPBCC family protein n=1 Tax=Streptomyces sp. WMMC500 TaxID=3015154 RepID=UPI00248B6F07|nr:SRPBCC domain-containing protein [Streptomyces sp. WMMC500]WBB63818.1 SRPBCC domain-containing protein [Streptomyces sp. WMMC500]